MFVIYLIIAGVVALLAAVFQYGKAKGKSKENLLFAFLRFLSVFAILMLLINPKFRKVTVYEEKPALAIVADNSSSIPYLGQQQQISDILSQLQQNTELAEKFSPDYYTFGKNLKNGDSLSFEEQHTNLSEALTSLKEIYRGKNASVIILTDGNQTYGEDYTYTSLNYPMPVFPVALGDTTTYDDLKIQRLNVNRYAYFRNKFPVEIILNYEGKTAVSSTFRLTSGNRTLYSENVNFSPEKRSEIIRTHLEAGTRGILTFRAEILPVENEKNTKNNYKEFGIEVIDQKTEVLIVSDIVHPDLGALKRSIESNEERTVTLSKPTLDINRINDYQLVILYQPDASFTGVFRQLEKSGKNTFIIGGKSTDWNFLNRAQKDFSRKPARLTEEVQGSYNESYSVFASEDIGLSRYPPLQVPFGDITVNTPYEPILFQKINGVVTKTPLLLTTEKDNKKTALLLGEDIWRWRMQDFRDHKNYEKFDKFIGKLVLYLASDKKRDRLETDYETLYDGTTPVVITAQYFDNNYIFNPEASLGIEVRNKDNNTEKTYPMLLRNNYYEADLSDLEAGEYTFTIRVEGENMQRSGQFRILEFDVEQQYAGADIEGLRKLAGNTGGTISYSSVSDSLYNILTNDERFKPVQKSKEDNIALVDWKILLFIIVLLLSAEWFLRKYRGLV
ncbi:VWA domain-containing protein [Sinomicrobium pectinilyticum]|uniref:VWA domain-containing protein n=1 Tax=Sinomicrobium pectinilyticum TaxID=1084421 RepID=A0A3N0E380_SINP1|nr:vWA domain-containing protein [Sinomicrobium pectinilyticum]RNL82249.1 VWA domain-containing protein [Sinomicrobium pectinilyticum]